VKVAEVQFVEVEYRRLVAMLESEGALLITASTEVRLEWAREEILELAVLT